nr:immunoglobulin heavy chain junction region [Mus musculus]
CARDPYYGSCCYAMDYW